MAYAPMATATDEMMPQDNLSEASQGLRLHHLSNMTPRSVRTEKDRSEAEVFDGRGT